MIFYCVGWLLVGVVSSMNMLRIRSIFAALSAAIVTMFAAAQTPATTPTLAAPAANAPKPVNAVPVASDAPRTGPLNVVMLLPLDHPLLKRAAMAVRDGIRASVIPTTNPVTLSECAYGQDGVVAAYQRCVTATTDWVIGPLGRNDVAALATAKLELRAPTLLLSPLGSAPIAPFAALAPELESEAEAIARQAGDDACRKPVLVDAGGPIAARISVAISALWKTTNAIPMISYEVNSRDRWQRVTEQWRRDGVDCVLFAGNGASLVELRPYLRGMSTYITSASFEVALERTVDWTGVRIADSPWLLDATNEDLAGIARPENMSPTLARLFALGIDALRLTLAAGRAELPQRFDGAIGALQLKDGQYHRTPMIGEFRGRDPARLGR
jgi:uncharacterized protein